MKKYIIAKYNSKITKNFLTVAGGSALAQILTIAVSPIITRIYNPEEIGIQGTVMAITNILAIIAGLSLPTAVLISRLDRIAIDLIKLSIYSTLIMATLLSILLATSTNTHNPSQLKDLENFRILLPIIIITTVTNNSIKNYSAKKSKFKLASKASILQSATTSLTKIGFGILNPTAQTLILSNIFGLASSIILIARKIFSKKTQTTILKNQTKRYKIILKKYKDYPLIKTPQELINALTASLPLLFLSKYYGATHAGYYSVALSVLATPTIIIGNSVMQVLYPKVNEVLKNGESLAKLILQSTIALLLVCIIPFTLLTFKAREIFEVVFGNQWGMAGAYAGSLSLWILFQLLNRPALAAIPALNLQKGLLIYEITSTIIKIIGLYLGYKITAEPVGTLLYYSLAGTSAYIGLIIWVILKSKESDKWTLQ